MAMSEYRRQRNIAGEFELRVVGDNEYILTISGPWGYVAGSRQTSLLAAVEELIPGFIHLAAQHVTSGTADKLLRNPLTEGCTCECEHAD